MAARIPNQCRLAGRKAASPLPLPVFGFSLPAFDSRLPRRRAFTLVELLVVVTIIGILVSLVVTAGFFARNRARESNVIRELGELNTALANYSAAHKELPPDFHGISSGGTVQQAAENAVIVHLAKRWPRYRPGAYCFSVDGSVRDDTSLTPFEKFAEDVNRASGGTVNARNFSPATALVFWLGGLPATGGSTPLQGFCADETNPLNPEGSRAGSLFEFDPTRLAADGSGALIYLPATRASSDDVAQPLVYFRAVRSLADRYEPAVQFWTCAAEGVNVRPYRDQAHNSYYQGDSFQILCAGLDNQWGVKYALPLDQGTDAFNGAEFDNLTSFLNGRLEDLSE